MPKRICVRCRAEEISLPPQIRAGGWTGHYIDGTWENDGYLTQLGYIGRWVCCMECYNKLAPSRRKRLFLKLEKQVRIHRKIAKGRYPRKDRMDKYLDIRKYIWLLFPEKRERYGPRGYDSSYGYLKPGLTGFSNADLEELISRIKRLNRKLTSQKI